MIKVKQFQFMKDESKLNCVQLQRMTHARTHTHTHATAVQGEWLKLTVLGRGSLQLDSQSRAPCAHYRPLHNESRTRFVHELSADRFSFGLLLQCSPQALGQSWRKGKGAPLCSTASVEKQHVFFLFRLQPTRHRYSLAHSTAHTSSNQSTKWHQTQ